MACISAVYMRGGTSKGVFFISMGVLHHAVTGTGRIALACAAVMPETLLGQLINRPLVTEKSLLGNGIDEPVKDLTFAFGHPSGKLPVAIEAAQLNGDYLIHSVSGMFRSARRLMAGSVFYHD